MKGEKFMEQLCEVMMRLIGSEIRGEVAEKLEENMLSEEFLTSLYKLSKSHDMSHIVGSALSVSGQLPKNEIGKKFEKQTFMAVFRYERLNYEYGQICAVLEKNGISYVPLKGAIVRDYYPKPWMRTSCDIDILVYEDELEKATEALCRSLSYTADEEKHYHDISLFSSSGIHLELHFSILESMDNIDRMLVKAWDYCHAEDGGYKYLQTNEYFMFHHIAHMAYHFVHGGCGIKPFADLYLLLEKMDFDEGMVVSYCNECGIGKFYESVKRLSKIWFGGETHDELTEQMEEFLLLGGVYGSQKNSVAVNQVKRGGKFKYMLSRIFLPMDQLRAKYPSLEKNGWLAPFYQVRRWFGVLFGGKLGRSVKELKVSSEVSDATSDGVGKMLKALEL